ncbi:MAG: MerR family transcriptional regulator [Flavobacteriaceae bacterium]|nr:MerR family transcriptional regulator [Candidatus Onthonaster equi]
MNRFTINQLSYLSGLPDKTILFWKKKYNAFQDCNLENKPDFKYNTEHLNRLLNISTLFHLDKKYDLQSICQLDNDTLQVKVEIELMSNLIKKNLNEDIINQLVASCLTYNETRFNLIIDSAIKKLTISDFYNFILYPFLMRIYETFQANEEKPVQFFYMKSLLKRKFHYLIECSPNFVDKKSKVLLFLPHGEVNEIGLLFCNLILKNHGFQTFYIGSNQTITAVQQAIDDISPDLIISFIPNNDNIKSYNATLESITFDLSKMMILGMDSNLKNIKNTECTKISKLEEFHIILDEYEQKKAEV